MVLQTLPPGTLTAANIARLACVYERKPHCAFTGVNALASRQLSRHVAERIEIVLAGWWVAGLGWREVIPSRCYCFAAFICAEEVVGAGL
jgi:hypothetical protein